MTARIPSLLRNDEGLTLIELLIGLVVGMVVTLAAFALLEFTTNDVSRITSRTHATQNARIQLEKLMIALHSACVAVTINPIQVNSNENALLFISETSPLNANKEPISSLGTVRLHKIIYTKAQGLLTEQTWTSSGENPNFKFSEGEKPTERPLLRGVSQTVAEGKPVPIFRYYRYYHATDTEPKYGQLNPTAMAATELANPLEVEDISKVTVNFTVSPEGAETRFARGDRAFAIEDSAVLRLSPSSESPTTNNQPCAQQ